MNIEGLFTYHTPNEDQIVSLACVRKGAKEFAAIIMANCPSSPDRTTAIRKLREAVMTANASIVVPVEDTMEKR